MPWAAIVGTAAYKPDETASFTITKARAFTEQDGFTVAILFSRCHLLYLRNKLKHWKFFFCVCMYTNFWVVLMGTRKEKRYLNIENYKRYLSIISFLFLFFGQHIYFELENNDLKYLSTVLLDAIMPSLLCSFILQDDIHSRSYYATKYDHNSVIMLWIKWFLIMLSFVYLKWCKLSIAG